MRLCDKQVILLQVNARNIDGATPLCDACNNGNIETVKTLLNSGADVNPELSFFTSPLHEAVTRGKLFPLVSGHTIIDAC